MTDRDAFLRAICAAPADDLARLVFADWLDENGEPERAEFIRVQVELHPYQRERSWLEQMPVEQWAGDEQEGELLRRLAPLVQRHTDLCNLYVRDCKKWSREFIAGVLGKNWLQRSATWQWGWERGFVSSVSCTLTDWQAYGPTIVRAQPVETVRLVDQQEPTASVRYRGWWRWFTWSGDEREVPQEIYAHLKGELPVLDSQQPYWRTRDLALTALSDAALTWAKKGDGPATRQALSRQTRQN